VLKADLSRNSAGGGAFASVLRSNKAACKLKLGAFNVALQDTEEAVRLDGANFKAYVCKGKALMSLGRLELAMGWLAAGARVRKLSRGRGSSPIPPGMLRFCDLCCGDIPRPRRLHE
jgi:hypothetical protein